MSATPYGAPVTLPHAPERYDPRAEAALRQALERELTTLRAALHALLSQQVSWTLSEATNTLKVTVRYHDGTLKSGSITLA